MSLRVISGTYRRRRLKTEAGRETRPYTDRVRQMVFDRLGETIEGGRIADVFAGVGTMGIEALSRGAASCVFIEGSPRIHALLKENVQHIVDGQPSVCWKTDVLRTSFRPQHAEQCLPYDFVFFDPPYEMADQLHAGKPLFAAVDRLGKDGVTDPDAIVLLRTPRKQKLNDTKRWRIAECWNISSMLIWKLRRKDNTHATAQTTADDGPASI
jgi:16S rRNA (guanine966-N2)-methyltransferase